jgi:hypothetical protein
MVAVWLAFAAALLLAGCGREGGASEARGDRYSARGQFADAAVEYEIALEAAGENAPSELRLRPPSWPSGRRTSMARSGCSMP